MLFGITDKDLRSILANVNMQHYGYQGITTDAGGKTIKSQNPKKTDPVYLFVPRDHKLCQYGGQMRKITLIEILSAFSIFNGTSGIF